MININLRSEKRQAIRCSKAWVHRLAPVSMCHKTLISPFFVISESNDILEDLDISWNHLRQKGARKVMSALLVSESHWLSVRCCLRQKGARKVMSALLVSESHSLSVRCCLRQKGARKVMSALLVSESHSLSVRCCLDLSCHKTNTGSTLLPNYWCTSVLVGH